MTEEMLENMILGHIAKELKDEIQIGRQVTLAKTIMQALRIHDVVGRSELLSAFAGQMQSIDVIRPEVDIDKYVEKFLSRQ